MSTDYRSRLEAALSVGRKVGGRFPTIAQYAEQIDQRIGYSLVCAALESSPCKCGNALIKGCPQCGTALLEVLYPVGSMLNREQFDSCRAGDYYCEKCRGSESRTGFKYFWESDLKSIRMECARCAALAVARGEQKAHVTSPGATLPSEASMETGQSGLENSRES